MCKQSISFFYVLQPKRKGTIDSRATLKTYSIPYNKQLQSKRVLPLDWLACCSYLSCIKNEKTIEAMKSHIKQGWDRVPLSSGRTLHFMSLCCITFRLKGPAHHCILSLISQHFRNWSCTLDQSLYHSLEIVISKNFIFCLLHYSNLFRCNQISCLLFTS